MNYVQSTDFRLATLSILPTDFFYLVHPPTINRPFVRFNRLLKVTRLMEFFERLDTSSNYPQVYRGTGLVLTILVAIHWNACFYIQASDWIGFGSDGWVYNMTNESTVQDMYIYSFYWSTLMLTSIGDVPEPTTDAECLFMIVDFFIAVLIFATIAGNLANMIGQMRRSTTDFEEQMDSVKRYMTLRKVATDFERRVIGWFDYVWMTGQSFDDERTLSILPDNLRTELAINVHLDTLKRVSIFTDCDSPGFLAKLVSCLRLVVYSPGDYVCRRGDIGKEMYIVKSGLLSVLAEDGRTPMATITGGGFFGEVSLLNIPGNATGNRRVADVKSIGYSDIFILSKNDLWSTLNEYPEAKHALIEVGREKLRQASTYEEKKAAVTTTTSATERRRKEKLSLEGRVDRLQKNIDSMSLKFNKWLVRYHRKQSALRRTILKFDKHLQPKDVFAKPR